MSRLPSNKEFFMRRRRKVVITAWSRETANDAGGLLSTEKMDRDFNWLTIFLLENTNMALELLEVIPRPNLEEP